MDDDRLKQRTAGTLKWSLIDRVATQLLYAVTGVVLARMLTQEDFGLVGAVMVFQAFASLLVDSGFSYALIQRKQPSQLDYSTVLWFNVGAALFLYGVAWICAPLIADCFGGDQRLIPLTRVMFLALPINASSIVQTNRLTKRMDVRLIAVANSLGLIAGAMVGIWLAITGAGAWAVVWQTLTLGTVKCAVLWVSEGWCPSWAFSLTALRSYAGVGSRMMATSVLNTLFQNIYSFFVGNRAGLVPLGYYSQSDKWSKMGITSISQVLTSSFLPALSAVQDQPDRFLRIARRMNRFTAYLLFPATIGLGAMATPLFHTLFGTKWDPSIMLFQLLLVRGIFTVLNSLYNNYILASGRTKAIVWLEILRDGAAILALVASLPWIAFSTSSDPVAGLRYMLWGQIAAAALTWIVSAAVAARCIGTTLLPFIADSAPYAMLTAAIIPVMLYCGSLPVHPLAACLLEAGAALTLYLGANALAGSRIQKDVLAALRRQ